MTQHDEQARTAEKTVAAAHLDWLWGWTATGWRIAWDHTISVTLDAARLTEMMGTLPGRPLRTRR